MRMEYVVIGFILVLIVLLVSITLLSGVLPSIDSVFKLFSGRT